MGTVFSCIPSLYPLYRDKDLVVDEKLGEIQEASNIILTGIEDIDRQKSADKLVESLTLESMVLSELLYIDEAQKPITIAISDSAKRLNKLLLEAPEIYDNVGSFEEKELIIKKVNDIKQKHSDAIFHYGS